MYIKIYTFCLLLYLCESATKIGLGNGRPSEEPSSLKTEIMKFKTSECGGSSSEEQTHNSKKKQKHRKKDSDEDEDEEDDDSEENNKKKKSKNNRGRQKNNRGYREDSGMSYSSTSFEHNKNFGMNRNPQEDYMNRRQRPGSNPFQGGWEDDPINNPYAPNPRNRNQFNPYGQNHNDEGYYPQNYNRRNPYGSPQDNYNRGYQQDDRYNNDRNSNRRKQHNRWQESSEDEEDYSRGNRRKNNQRRGSNNRRNRNKSKKNKNNSADGECVSQCVFNNMEIMEDDGIPSEAGMIKWAQDKIKNEKLKQSAVKEIRKCFGQLATSDGENSCNFSKSLSSCLKLHLDDDKD